MAKAHAAGIITGHGRRTAHRARTGAAGAGQLAVDANRLHRLATAQRAVVEDR